MPAILTGLITAILLLWPLAAGPGSAIYYRIMGMACFYAVLALSWNILALTGAISLGHAAFFGLGAYGSALTSHYWHVSPFVTIFIGGFIGAAYGILWSVLFKRLRKAYFALATMASVEIPRVVIDNSDNFTYGSLGLVGISKLPVLSAGPVVISFGDSLRVQYYTLLLFMLAIAWVHYKSIFSNWGWAIRAVREDECAAAALGVNVFKTRFQALTLSAFLTGICGGLYAHLIGLIEPSLVFSLHISAIPLVMSIFGGRCRPFGPILGALVLYPLDQLLFHAWLPSGHAILYGLVVMAALIFFPEGVGAWVQQRLKSV
jgi:branched-chain amino acid transport system permease protein